MLSGIGEFILGNHFPMVVFITYGKYPLGLLTTLLPS